MTLLHPLRGVDTAVVQKQASGSWDQIFDVNKYVNGGAPPVPLIAGLKRDRGVKM